MKGLKYLALFIGAITCLMMSGVAAVKCEQGKVNGVYSSWKTVALSKSYSNMVVVCTPQYAPSTDPVVIRVDAANGDSFKVMAQTAKEGGGDVSITVHYFVIEEGKTIDLENNLKIEAGSFLSTTTDSKNGGYNAQTVSTELSFSSPVVLGQVMTYNDTGHSVFWASGLKRDDLPSNVIKMGKHVGEDDNINRLDEKIGYVIIEAGDGLLNGKNFSARVGAETIAGLGNEPPYEYSVDLGVIDTVICSNAALLGADGTWPVLMQSPGEGTLHLAVDEDTLNDSERAHRTERIAYLAFGEEGGFPDTEAPSIPAGLVASALSTSSVHIQWSAATDNVGVTGYNLFRNGGSSPIATVNRLELTDNDLLADTEYTYQISAVDAAGNESGKSSSVSVQTMTPDTRPPTRPENLNATMVTARSLQLNWTASTDDHGIDSYRIYFENGDFVGDSVTEQYAVYNLQPSREYRFYVVAHDTAGNISEASEVLYTNTSEALPLLAEFNVINNIGESPTVVSLQNTYVDPVIVCTPLYKESGPFVVRVSDVGPNQFSCRIQKAGGVPTGDLISIHYIVVEKGIYTLEEHGIQMEADTTLSSVTDGKSKKYKGQTLSVSNSYSSPVVFGQVMSENDNRFSVFWSKINSIPPSGVPVINAGKHVGEDPSVTRENETIGYIIIESGIGVLRDVRYLATAGIDTIQGFDNSKPFEYNLSALDRAEMAILSQSDMDGGDGSWAVLHDTPDTIHLSLFVDEDIMKDNERKHTTENVNFIVFENVSEPFEDTTPPPVPNGLVVLALDHQSIRLQWNESAESGVTYTVYDGENNVLSSSQSESYFVHSGLQENTTYAYQVRATDAAENTSEFSDLVHGTTLDLDDIPPEAPKNLKAVATSHESIELTWDAATDDVGVVSYSVHREDGLVVENIMETHYLDMGLLSETTYAYTVTALDARPNTSGPSNRAEAATWFLDTIPPEKPVIQSLEDQTEQLYLSWSESTDNVGTVHYLVYRNGVQIGLTPSLEYNDGDSLITGLYQYSVVAVDGAGNRSTQSESKSISITRESRLTTFYAGEKLNQSAWSVLYGKVSRDSNQNSYGTHPIKVSAWSGIELKHQDSTTPTWISLDLQPTGNVASPPVVEELSEEETSTLLFIGSNIIWALDGDGEGGGAWVKISDQPTSRYLLQIEQDLELQKYKVWINGVMQKGNLGFRFNSVNDISTMQLDGDTLQVLQHGEFSQQRDFLPVYQGPKAFELLPGQEFGHKMKFTHSFYRVESLDPLPGGLTLDEWTGQISGVPFVATVENVRFKVSDSELRSTEFEVKFNILNSDTPPEIEEEQVIAVRAGHNLHASVLASPAPQEFSTSGSLPFGIGFNSFSGILSGVPVNEGIFDLNVTASNRFGSSVDTPVQLIVNAHSALKINAVEGGLDLMDGEYFNFKLGLIGDVERVTLKNGDYLPEGLRLDEESGLIYGSPIGGGAYHATFIGHNDTLGLSSEPVLIQFNLNGPDTTAPIPPENLSGSAPVATRIELSWSPAVDFGGVIDKYILFRNGIELRSSLKDTSYSDTDVLPETSYSYHVIAVDDSGNRSDASEPIVVTTPELIDLQPDSPQLNEAVALPGQRVSLSWSSADPAAESFQIFRSHAGVDQLVTTLSSTMFVDSGLMPESDYIYTIVALNWNNTPSERSNALQVTTTAESSSELVIEFSLVDNVNTSFQTIQLHNNYNNPVIVCTPQYERNQPPVVARISNITTNSFDIKAQIANQTGGTTNVKFHILVVEKGVYNVAEHGVKLEADFFTSNITNTKPNYNNAVERNCQHSWLSPVIVGQVMSTNDEKFSTFWSSASNDREIQAEGGSNFQIGKHAGEDANSDRADEKIGYIIIESGSGDIGPYQYKAGVSSNIIPGNTSSAVVGHGMSHPEIGILSPAGLIGADGHWPVFEKPLSSDTMTLFVDEDQMKDNERAHIEERTSYLILK